MFSKLNRLILHKLPKVKCFYPRKHKIECPALTDLSVADCGNLSTFDILSFPSKQRGDQFEKVMSKLDEMSIRSADLENIQRLYDGHFPPHFFSSLESLSIVGSDVFPSEFFGMIHKQLKIFKLHDCSFQEIFPYEGEFTNHANDHTLFLPQLYRLQLKKLPQLKYICKHDQKKSLILNILGRLEYISVEECPLLTNLVQPSTARSLEKLYRLSISGCKKVEKVIGDDHDEESSGDGDNEIIFPNLEYLYLEKLPRLTSFCSSPNYTFNFPELTWVTVRECPNMKTFSVGITTTPMLENVKYNDEECWEGDLNTTLQKVFAKAESPRLIPTLPSASLNNQEAEVHGNAAEPTNEHQVVGEISEQGTFTENAIEPAIETEICAQHVVPSSNTNLEVEAQLPYESSKKVSDDPIIESQVHENAAEKSVNLEVRELAQLLPSTSSTNHTEAAALVPENLAEAQNDATNAEKMAITFEKGFVASPEETNPPPQTSLSHSTELEVRRSTFTVESEVTDPKQGSEIVEEVLQGVNLLDICDKTQEQLHPPISNTLQVTSQQKDRIHVKSAEKVNDEPIREAEIGAEKLVNKAEICGQEVVGEGQVADAVSLASQPYDELSPCATPEVQRLPSKVPNNLKMKKARNPIHGPNWFTNWKRTLYILWLLGLFITGSIWVLLSFSDHGESPAACEEAAPILLDHFNLSKNQHHALDPPFSESDQVVGRSTPTVESEATYPKKGSDIRDKALSSQLHPPTSNTLQAAPQQKDFQELHVTNHFIPLMSKVLEIVQTRPLNRMRPEHVKFMEDASRELSHMNFPMDWLCPYIDKAKNCLSVVERTNAVSEVELKIAEVESQLQALQESKRTLEESKKSMEEENKVIAFSMDLDKPLYEYED